MRNPSGKRVRLRHRPGFAHSVLSRKNLHLRRLVHLTKMIGLDSPSQVLALRLLVIPLRFTVVSLPLAFLLSFPLSCLSCLACLSLGALHLPVVHLCQCPESCVAQIVASSVCKCHLSHVRTQGLISFALCPGNHFQEITVSCWCMFHHNCYLDSLLEVCVSEATRYCATSFRQEASRSTRSRPSLYIFSHLARGLRMPLKSAAVRFPSLPSYSSFTTRHGSRP